MNTIKISVRNLVEFILRSGDLTTSSGLKDPDAMQEGTRIHKKIQRKMNAGYQAEVSLSLTVPINYDGIDFEICVEGRADGIFTDETGYNIDEIKGVYRELASLESPVEVHRAQALCYGYIWASTHKLDGIGIQMTYCHIPTEEIRRFNEYIDFKTLEKWFYNLLHEYAKWASWEIKWHEKRNLSIKNVEFPFEYRPGQNTLVKGVYQTILRRKRLYIEAPTGVGKTISTVFPAVRAMGENLSEKIFYLTAKTITRTVAQDAFNILTENGMHLKYITITAKEKICILDKPVCNPGSCPRALGHFDRVNDAVFDVITHEEHITREIVSKYAEKHNVCPFEMCLDISTWVDAVIGDYNYAFDPNACLKRFFGTEATSNDYIFLIDEAHNLVDRAREMYSATLIKEDFPAMKKLTKFMSQKITTALERCNRSLLALKRDCDIMTEWDILSIEDFVIRLMQLANYLDEYLQDSRNNKHGSKNVNGQINFMEFDDVDNSGFVPDTRERLLDFYFSVRSFLNTYELLDEKYIIYSDYSDEGNFRLHLQCMDPSTNLNNYLKKGRCGIFFSATFLPIKYYMEQLAGGTDDYAIYAPSPFLPENRLIMIGRDVSTKYTRRVPSEYKKIADYITNFVSAKTGNYLIFFSSYKMIDDVLPFVEENFILQQTDSSENISEISDTADTYNNEKNIAPHIFIQSPSMNEQQREEFLENFKENPTKTTLGFCVMGGIFGEGIDLKENRLIGAVIVGTGLPMVCTENELFKDYFDRSDKSGFDYSYRYPGMNKVLQSAGRVIRTDKDKGAILLLDERFMQISYQKLFPKEWYPYEVVTRDNIKERVMDFWANIL
ncbi:ATP-dependent DNA helicase [Eubacterium sp. MSJ-13]|uniref:ATP-dependent DNA helicase n=1 Tax=Eubacterium sp. MSJ-13 TaxID=2841513 RepID=UPI001C11C830|nr:ATP-dependent DNA helicase [Eubacterium sp. MSJ-13]MBU5478877.1 ATP-dependent DNA helicase [Eubacterium sp. MSJ-13]